MAAEVGKDRDMLDEHNALLFTKQLIRHLMRAEDLFPEWLRRPVQPRILSKDQVLDRIGDKNWEAFDKFMIGQTLPVGSDGKIAYYEGDVDKFKNKPDEKSPLSD